MRTIFTIIILLLVSTGLFSASIVDNKLVINVLIAESEEMSLELTDSASIFEDNSPFVNNFADLIDIEIVEADTTMIWTITDTLRTKPVTWQDFTLQCHHSPESFSFSSNSDAIAYALANEIDISRISSVNSNQHIVKISDGKKDILGQLPLNITTHDTLIAGKYKYTGNFRLYSNKDKLQLVNIIEIEEYLKSVVAYEIGSNSPEEALKAQAVASRSMTLIKLLASKHEETYIDLCATTHCQVFGGFPEEMNSLTKLWRIPDMRYYAEQYM